VARPHQGRNDLQRDRGAPRLAPTLLAAAGVTDVKEQLLKGMKVGDETYKVHLDGYNLLPMLTGKTKESPRKEFFYFNDDSDLVGLRYDNWKFVFAEQRIPEHCRSGESRSRPLRLPKLFNLRTDPFERADITSNTYHDWFFDHAFICVPAQHVVGEFLETFKEFPPSQAAGSFSVDQVLDKAGGGLIRRQQVTPPLDSTFVPAVHEGLPVSKQASEYQTGWRKTRRGNQPFGGD
jgi:arylsulfatase